PSKQNLTFNLYGRRELDLFSKPSSQDFHLSTPLKKKHSALRCPLCPDIPQRLAQRGTDPIIRIDSQVRLKALPIAKVAASSNTTSSIGVMVIGTSQTVRAERRNLSVTEARSRFGDELVKTDHFA